MHYVNTVTIALSIIALFSIGAVSQPKTPVFFDDFTYDNAQQMKKNGWILRTEAGWPGVPGATWSEDGCFATERSEARVRAHDFQRRMELRRIRPKRRSAINANTWKALMPLAFVSPTQPLSGPGGDQIVQSFYTISPLKAPMDPDYSELDYEYLPNGGWGIDGPTLYATTWETFIPEPNWKKDNVFKTTNGSQAGWHTLVTQVMDQEGSLLRRRQTILPNMAATTIRKTRCRSTSISGLSATE